MSSSWRAGRAWLLTPDRAQTRLDVRGFHLEDEATRQQLKRVGESSLEGFRHPLEATAAEAVAGRLESVDRPSRGFAVLDGLTPDGGTRVGHFLAGPAAPHILARTSPWPASCAPRSVAASRSGRPAAARVGQLGRPGPPGLPCPAGPRPR